MRPQKYEIKNEKSIYQCISNRLPSNYQSETQRNNQRRQLRREREEQIERQNLIQIAQQKQIEFTNWFNYISKSAPSLHTVYNYFQNQNNLEDLFNNIKIHANQLDSYITLMSILAQQGQFNSQHYQNLILRSSSFNTQVIERCNLLLLYQDSIDKIEEELELVFELFSSLKINDYNALKQSSISNLFSLLKVIELYTNKTSNEQEQIFRKSDKYLKQIYSTAQKLEWRETPIYPVELEFISFDDKKVNQLFGNLERLPIDYCSLNEYLDYHFNILRVNYIFEIQCAIQSLISTGFQKIERIKTSNVGFYQNMELLSVGLDNSNIKWKILVEQFNLDGRKQKNINWENSKQLQSGSLICLTNLECYPLIFGVITQRDQKQNRYNNGNRKIELEFKLINPNTSIMQFFNLFSQKTILMQFEGLIDPVLYYLDALKNKTSFPFENIIIQNENSISYPQYLDAKYIFDIDLSLSQTYQGYRFNIFQDPWPRFETSLDQAQLNAIKLMLQKEVALIQGPPGTGKTYCGALFVKLLYHNLQIQDFPILIVCYTNHALDQFLEHIIKFVPIQDVARLGGSSKNPILQQCQLQGRQNVDFEFKEFQQLKNKIRNIIRKILNYNFKIRPKDIKKYWPELYDSIIKNFFQDNHFNEIEYDYENGEENLVNYWINSEIPEEDKIVYGDLSGMDSYFEMDQFYKENKKFLDLQKNSGLQNQQYDNSDEELDEYLDSEDEATHKNHAYREGKFDSLDLEQDFENFNELHQNQNLLHYDYPSFKKIKDYLDQSQSNPWRLNSNDIYEIKVYLECLRYQNCSIKFTKLYKQFVEKSTKLKTLYDENEIQILNSKKIVGVTVSGVAKQANKLQKLNSKIMIIEEAAEVLESHVASILTSNLQHLILIGDHQQLKPQLKNYELEKMKANVSLFERLFLKKVSSVTLAFQRRMKTKFADFIRLIYGQFYQDHPIVAEKNNIEITGLEKDLVFFNHKWLEDQDGQSKQNRKEAEMIYEMVQFLLKCGYKQTQISVLSLYLKQAQVLKRKFMNSQQLQVKTQTVDNYQGEENDIVIISLVRNNKQNKLGYIKIENRINVALSRARIGLYVFGNFDFIFNASPPGSTWQKMINLAKEKNCLNDYINIKCQPHGNCQTIRQPDDWIKFKPKICNSKCLKKFNGCDHQCDKLCHISEQHPAESCPFQCDRMMKCGHKCKLKCVEKCKCDEIVDLILPCKHRYKALCGTNPITIKCKDKVQLVCSKNNHATQLICDERSTHKKCLQVCQKKLPCGHQCMKPCFQDCGQCEQECQRKRPCGHNTKCNNLCFQNCTPCDSNCNKQRPCGHDVACSMKCFQECSPCTFQCQQALRCGHEATISCFQKQDQTFIKNYICVSPCDRISNCGHNTTCKNQCYQKCTPCNIQIQVVLKCDHIQQALCYQDPNQILCYQSCKIPKRCGHICKQRCGQICLPCDEIITKKFPSCHHQKLIKCCEYNQFLICNQQVQIKYPCDKHTTYIPCFSVKNFKGECLDCKLCTIF